MSEYSYLSTEALQTVFRTLSDGPQAPSGTYDGQVWSPDYPRLAAAANRVWRGKVIRGALVTNLVLGTCVIEGILVHQPKLCQWEIDYPRLGLRDELRWAEGYWLGRMAVRQGWIWFTLRQA